MSTTNLLLLLIIGILLHQLIITLVLKAAGILLFIVSWPFRYIDAHRRPKGRK